MKFIKENGYIICSILIILGYLGCLVGIKAGSAAFGIGSILISIISLLVLMKI